MFSALIYVANYQATPPSFPSRILEIDNISCKLDIPPCERKLHQIGYFKQIRLESILSRKMRITSKMIYRSC